MKTIFKPGDIVRLLSGGHNMTVQKYTLLGWVRCDWHDEHGASWESDYKEHEPVKEKP